MVLGAVLVCGHAPTAAAASTEEGSCRAGRSQLWSGSSDWYHRSVLPLPPLCGGITHLATPSIESVYALKPNLNLKVGSDLYSNQLSRSMYLMDTVSPRTAGLKDCLLTLAMLPPSHILDVCNTSLYPGAIPYPLAVAEVLPWWDLS